MQVVKLVQAIRKGLIKTRAQKLEEEKKENDKPKYYDIWGDDQNKTTGNYGNNIISACLIKISRSFLQSIS